MISIREIDGMKIAGWVSGADWQAGKKALVFIHGSGGDHTIWLHQCTGLKNDYNIAAIDLPGHGRSEGPGEQDVSAYVAWVKKILGAFAIEKPILVGHSLGAAISLTFALMHDDLAGIVLAGGGATMPVNPAILEGIKADPAAIIAMAAKISVAKGNRDRISGILIKGMSGVNPDALYGDFLACSKLDVTADVSRIKVPTLILCGEEDKMTPPAMSQFLKDRIPGAQLATIQNAGHFAMLENVEEFNGRLKAFVDALP